ncbi:MAG: c(7)-type cytochrome triheme domain-containing protein [Desulfuromonadales bacterium]
MGTRIFGVVLVISTALLLMGLSMDNKEDIERILKSTPPTGPFWMYGTVIMNRLSTDAEMKPVVFNHWSHRAKYTCRVCHLNLEFSMKAGDTEISTDSFHSEKYCGACHNGKASFTLKCGPKFECPKCHMEEPKVLEQTFAKFAAPLPKTGFGDGIDWGKALRDGKISPKNSLGGENTIVPLPEKLRQPFYFGTASHRSDVKFSHEQHSADLDCSGCHPDLFNIKNKGTQKFTTEANHSGSFCSACHMKVAFPMKDCRRCHSTMASK